MFLNDVVNLLCIYSNGLLQPRELQLGAPNAYSVESLYLLYQFLLFVIYCSLWLFSSAVVVLILLVVCIYFYVHARE